MAVKLPKQFKHWCRLTRMKPRDTNIKCKLRWYNLEDEDRFFQVNDTHISVSCRKENFDKMQNSTMLIFSIPKTKREFLTMLATIDLEETYLTELAWEYC